MTAEKNKPAQDDTGQTAAEGIEETGADVSGVLESGYPQGVGQPEGNREGQIDTSDEDGQELKDRLDKEHGA